MPSAGKIPIEVRMTVVGFRDELRTASSSTDKEIAKVLAWTVVNLQELQPDKTSIDLSQVLNTTKVRKEIDRLPNFWLLNEPPPWLHMMSVESQILRGCQVFGLEPEEPTGMATFKSVVTILATAASRTTMKPEYLAREEAQQREAAERQQEEDMRRTKERIQTYHKYVKAAQKTDAERMNLRFGLSKLPAEMRSMVFGHLAQITLPAKIRVSEQELALMALQVLRPMADIRGYQEPNKHIALVQIGDEISLTINELVVEYGNEVQRAIIESLPIFNTAEFPTKALTSRIPIPPFLATGFLNTLLRHLLLELNLSVSRSTHYPAPLYNAQDQICNIKQWAPGLRSLRLEIMNSFNQHDGTLAVNYVRRLPDIGYTPIEEELERLVESLKKAEVCEKAVRYHEAWWTRLEGWEADRSEIDARGLESVDVMHMLSSKSGRWVWL